MARYTSEVTKAVIPAAGLGTRFLPLTKAQPKEMLPVVDKPTIQYVVEEAVASGITDILMITGRGKRAIEDHFDRSFELEAVLREKEEHERVEALELIARLADIYYIRQKVAAGLGHAVLCAKDHVGDSPFAVLLGDVITVDTVPCTRRLIDTYLARRASVIAVERVPKDQTQLYGIIRGREVAKGLYQIEDLVEKPRPEEAPSDLASVGRYVLSPAVFAALDATEPGVGGEVQLTDALQLLLKEEPVFALDTGGRRYDIGNKLSWIKALVELALENRDFGDELRTHLQQLLGERRGVRT